MKYKEDKDRDVMLDEVVVTATAPRQEKLKKVVPIADIVDEVKPLPYERVNEMQNKATSAVRASRVNTNPERLNIPKYDVKKDLSVGIEPLYDDEMEDLQNSIKIPQKESSAVLPEVKNSARGGIDNPYELPEVEVTASAPRRRLEMPKYEHDLPKNIEQRDIKPVAVKEGSEKQGKQRRTLKDILDKAHNLRREMTPEERARWERNAAIMGDIARLGAQSYAIANGAWKIEKAEPETKKANERIRALREREYARMAQQAKERQERLKEQAKEALEQERWQKKFDADKEHQQWEKDKFDKELGFKQQQHDDNMEIEREKLKNKVKTAIETENITVNGKTYSKEKDGANYLIKAYVDAGMPPITRRVQQKNDVGGYDYNDDGSPIYLDVPVSNPTDAEIAMALLGANTAGKKMAGFKSEKSAGFSK
jgi:hypothetical protein